MELLQPLISAAVDYQAFLKNTGNNFRFFRPNIPGKTIVGDASDSNAGGSRPGVYAPGETI
eukprot:13919948-Heterocapsa_arctica.AAC.1